VIARLLAGGVAWVAALGLFAALLQWSGSATPKVTSALDGHDPLSRSINQARLASSHPERARWTATKSVQALAEMVVEVAAERPEEATAIARQIIEPAQRHYSVILVYVRAVNQQADPVVRRIEWSPRDGYQHLTYR
jgi:hypothetical protein